VKTRLAVDILDLIGKLGHAVATRSPSTSSLRRLYRPERATPAQRQARDDWRVVDTAWQALGDLEVTTWNTWRTWDPRTGYSLFMKVNYPRQRAGLPLLTLPPDIPPWP